MLSHPAAYVHFPWCVRKCPYCDFNSHPLKAETDFAGYVQALRADWNQQRDALDAPVELASVFLGGGTPSLFSGAQIEAVLAELPLAAHAEVTMEANPGATEHAEFEHYLAGGVNRLSLGAQSFQDAQLERLGRVHRSAETSAAFASARRAGFANINLDLMWGLPGQSVALALADLEAALALGPEHISWYQLTIEAKTEFARRPPILPVEERLADIEREGLALLADAGYVRYEISAFARPGYQCRHNLNYWQFGDYLGLGAGAHGKLTRTTNPDSGPLTVLRTQKHSQPRLYLSAPTHTRTTSVARNALPLEFLMNALRLVEGVSWAHFRAHTGLEFDAIAERWRTLEGLELVAAERCAATPRGLRYLDSVLAEFVDD